MSIFSATPDKFPLNVSLKTRPVSFSLKTDLAQAIPTVILSLVWTILGTSLLYAWADPLSAWPGDDVATRALALLALLLFLVFCVGGWLWPAANEALRKVDVEIDDTTVHVKSADLLGRRAWSKPLSDYDGLLIENWGTRSVGNDKIAIAAVVLKHRDDRCTIPLVIDGALRVKAPAARRKAEQLGLTLLADTIAAPDGTPLAGNRIVVNGFQALKVKVLYALVSLGGLAGAGWLAILAHQQSDPTLLAASIAALALAAAMHLFASHYVTAMSREASTLVIETAAFLAPAHRIPRSAVVSVDYREGRSTPGMVQSVHAPWVKVRVSGYRLPFIVDMQSDFVDEAALQSLSKPAE
ncbi:MAG: hypothetical protein B7Y80_09875 [Hyphomicrobium sp. 32-62-53]|nr:MAG: hypothetical protein B7Z29_08850 [Hyphomicrobium sp. 12-62-95]OYX99883.1 MAG: hypothetical protein B7Y80_09875 [Hyphomicrobium sp. 32-62-53]